MSPSVVVTSGGPFGSGPCQRKERLASTGLIAGPLVVEPSISRAARSIHFWASTRMCARGTEKRSWLSGCPEGLISSCDDWRWRIASAWTKPERRKLGSAACQGGGSGEE